MAQFGGRVVPKEQVPLFTMQAQRVERRVFQTVARVPVAPAPLTEANVALQAACAAYDAAHLNWVQAYNSGTPKPILEKLWAKRQAVWEETVAACARAQQQAQSEGSAWLAGGR